MQGSIVWRDLRLIVFTLVVTIAGFVLAWHLVF